jgi:hypothetical protein
MPKRKCCRIVPKLPRGSIAKGSMIIFWSRRLPIIVLSMVATPIVGWVLLVNRNHLLLLLLLLMQLFLLALWPMSRAAWQAAADWLAVRCALPPPQTLAMLAGAEVLQPAAPCGQTYGSGLQLMVNEENLELVYITVKNICLFASILPE